MRTSRMILPTIVLVLAVTGLARAQNLLPLDKVTSYGPTRIVTELTGDQEIGSVATRTTGHAYFDVRPDGSLHYRISTTGMSGITGIYIQQGRSGQIGPVIAQLYVPAQPTGFTSGTLAEGTLTASQLRGPLAGHSVNDLARMMMDNNAYVNVTTAIYSTGELRGNIPYSYH